MQFATLAPTPRPGAMRMRSAAATEPEMAAAGPPATPGQRLEAANERIRDACVARRFADAAQAARAALPHCEAGSVRESLMRLLAQARPGAVDAPGEDRLWMLQRLDGTMVALVRLRDNGEVANGAHANESRWTLRDGHLLLCAPNGQPTTAFTLGGRHQGRRVFAGLFMDSLTVHVLTEVDCAYSQLRSLDPELTGAFASLFAPDQLATPPLPAQPAVLLAAPRTGSHLLLNLLNSSGRVFFDAELLNPVQISMFGHNVRPEEAGALYSLRANDPVHFLKVMLARSHHSDGRLLDGVPVRGFKLFPQQSERALAWVLAEPAMRIVHLHRANLLAEFSSLLVAYAGGHWVGGPSTLKARRIAFDDQRFLRFVEMKRRALGRLRERLAVRGGDVAEIEYSAFSHTSLNQLLSFLLRGQPSDVAMSALGLQQQLNECVIDRFDNPADVHRCLAAIGHEDWAGIERPAVDGL
jgi:LPS sulfotransferase NodH